MVNFDSGEILQTPISDLYKLLILQRRHDFMEALERWLEKQERGSAPDSYVKARLWTLYLEIYPMIKEDEQTAELGETLENKIIQARTPGDYRSICILISMFLFKKRIITTIPRLTGKIDQFKTGTGKNAITEVFEESESLKD